MNGKKDDDDGGAKIDYRECEEIHDETGDGDDDEDEGKDKDDVPGKTSDVQT